MPKQQSHIGVVREWCVSLGVLTAVSISRQEAEMKLAAYLPLLMHDFPDAAFTGESLQDVARECTKGFPTYPELSAQLSAWWKKHRPQPRRITVEQSNIMAQQRALHAEIASSWDDPTGIMRRVHECGDNLPLLRLLVGAVSRWAPQHLGLLPPKVLELMARDPDIAAQSLVQIRNSLDDPSYIQPLSEVSEVRARHMTPAQLDQVNPLPDGRKRVGDRHAASAADC